MGEKEEINKAPTAIMDQILDETFQKLDEKEDFDSEILLELRKNRSEGLFPDEKRLISILRGDHP